MRLVTSRFEAGTGWVPPLDRGMDSPQTLVLAFGAPELADQPAPLAELAAAFPNSVVTGCSTAGEIWGDQIADGGIVLAVAKFEGTRLALAHADVGGPEDSYAAGERLARTLGHDELRGVLVFSDGLAVNGTDLVRGINASLPERVVVTGGLAGDGARFQRTWVLRDGAPHAGSVTAVGLYGDRIALGHGSRGGWDKFGPERRITRSKGNVLYEIDGRPALELYQRYLGDRAKDLPSSGLLFPLSLRSGAEDTEPVVRTLLAIDAEQQSMTFAGNIPEGWLVQLMCANFDRLIAGAADAGELTRREEPGPNGDVLSIAISCVGRRLVLGERVEEELEAVLEVLPAGALQIGFYSYGELSPHTSGPCILQNQTMTLTTLRERKAA